MIATAGALRTDHVWDDVIDDATRKVYAGYARARERGIRGRAALLAIDVYEAVFMGGAKEPAELVDRYPSSCGRYAHEAIAPIQRLLAAARAAGLVIAYSTGEPKPSVRATQRAGEAHSADEYRIKDDFAPAPGDLVVRKQRASAFFGTPLAAYLVERGIGTVIVCGETTSGCVRASAVDAYSSGFHVVVVEEGCFDRGPLSHKVNLFDLHHKYADVMHVEEVVAALHG